MILKMLFALLTRVPENALGFSLLSIVYLLSFAPDLTIYHIKRTPFNEKRPFYWFGYGLRWLCGTIIPLIMSVCDYIPLMSPVIEGGHIIQAINSPLSS